MESRKRAKLPVRIKQGLVINIGENPTRESKLRLIEENRKKYEKSEQEIAAAIPSQIDLFAVKRAKRLQFVQFLKRYFAQKEKQQQENGGITGNHQQQQQQQQQLGGQEGSSENLSELKSELKQSHERIKQLEAKLKQRLLRHEKFSPNGCHSNPPSPIVESNEPEISQPRKKSRIVS